MTKPNYTHIVCILDRSGSMGSIRDDAMGGFNAFLEDQKNTAGEATISLVQFDDQYEVCYSFSNISFAIPLTHQTYIPRGSTALLDAVGKAIISTGKQLSSMPEHNRPSQVLVLIITDGEENSSTEFTKERIKAMVEEQQNKWQWKFVYIGAGVDAFDEAGRIGINQTYSKGVSRSGGGILRAMNLAAGAAKSYRTEGEMGLMSYMHNADTSDLPEGSPIIQQTGDAIPPPDMTPKASKGGKSSKGK